MTRTAKTSGAPLVLQPPQDATGGQKLVRRASDLQLLNFHNRDGVVGQGAARRGGCARHSAADQCRKVRSRW